MAAEDYGDLEKPVLAALQKLGNAAKITDLLKQLHEDEPSAADMTLMDFTSVVAKLAARGKIENSRGMVKSRGSSMRSLGSTQPGGASRGATPRQGPKVVPTSKPPAQTVPIEQFDPKDPEAVHKPLLAALINTGGSGSVAELHPLLQEKSSADDLRLMEVVTAVDALEKKGLLATSGRGFVRITTAGRQFALGKDVEIPEEEPASEATVDDPSSSEEQNLSKMYHKKIQNELSLIHI